MSITQSSTGVNDSVAESQANDTFKPIPDDQLIDAASIQEAPVVETPATPPAPEVVAPVETKVEDPKVANFEAFRNEIKEKISKIDELEQVRQVERQKYEHDLALLKSQVHQKSPHETRKEGPFGDFEDDYVPSVGELKKAFNAHDKDLRDKMDEMQTMQAFPDYQEILQKDLVPFIKDKPYFAQMISQAPNKAMAAYEIGKMARMSKTQAMPPQQAQPAQPPSGTPPSVIAQKIVDNANKPGSLATAGGIGSPLSKADYYASLSDEDFAKIAMKNLAEI